MSALTSATLDRLTDPQKHRSFFVKWRKYAKGLSMSSAPIEFSAMGLHGEFFEAKKNEFHGPCPRCGGEDRFIVHTADPFPKWFAWCRPGVGHCGWRGWADQLNESLRQPITAEQKQQWHEERKRREAEREAAALKAIEPFTVGEIWKALNKRMTFDNRQWWRDQGIPDSWQDYLDLGYTPTKNIQTKQGLLSTPAYTIPYFHNSDEGKQFKTMQYRLVAPPNPNDRYRFEHGLHATYYMTDPLFPVGDKVVLVEGAKKAVVVATLLHNDYTVIGYPSKDTLSKAVEAVKDCGYIRIIPDPDGIPVAREFVKAQLPTARVVTLFGKVDDLINQSGMSKADVLAAMRQAR